MTCGLTIEGRHYSGFVLDISDHGLYVQTSARPSPGTLVDIELALPTRKEPVRMHAKVARQKLVPPELLSVAQGGIGLHVDEPPDVFTQYYFSVAPPEALAGTPVKSGGAPAAGEDRTTPGEAGEAPRYRVRVSQLSGPRSRTIMVACDTAQEAQEKALATVGEGWKVLSADPV
jgi:hypothetical protein